MHPFIQEPHVALSNGDQELKPVSFVCMSHFSISHLHDTNVSIALPVREAHVAPSVGGPELKTTRVGIPDQVALVGALRLGLAKAEEAGRIICTKPQKDKL